jgi:hypothetical protein
MNKSRKKFVLINNNLITEFDKPRNFKELWQKICFLYTLALHYDCCCVHLPPHEPPNFSSSHFTTNWLFQTNHSKKMTYSSPRQHWSHSFSFYFYFRVLKLVSLYEFEDIIDWKHGWKSLEIYFVRFISL